jgi:hypothetical protein
VSQGFGGTAICDMIFLPLKTEFDGELDGFVTLEDVVVAGVEGTEVAGVRIECVVDGIDDGVEGPMRA